MILRFIVCLFAISLCGCGPSAKQLAEQQAHQTFREAVAALKVCTSGSTYAEFRDKWMALETCYTANQNLLKEDETQMQSLIALARAVDNIWNINNQINADPAAFVSSRHHGDWTDSLNVVENFASPSQVTFLKTASRDKFPEDYIQTGLTLISNQCDELLK